MARRSPRLVPADGAELTLDVDGRAVKLTNLGKPFWTHITKGDLIQYYVDVAPYLLPHLRDRAMVMKRYPHGAAGEFFFMKRAPTPRPPWIETVAIEHDSGNVIDFPLIQDLPSLMWCINLGCIDLNQWYARADDVNRPDYVHFDLDPGTASFAMVKETARLLDATLRGIGMTTFVKTSGSKGVHVYVPIVRGPLQKQVWTFAKTVSVELAKSHPELMTAVYVRAKRPEGRVLVDYNQNRWGSTLASIYSVRPTPHATVSTPVTWDELPGVEIADFTLENVPERLEKIGDLWAPVASPPDDPVRFDTEKLMKPVKVSKLRG
ncbi:MAG TPA: non-homologous end-joining DNA ligase [Polyangia bacterium]|jgi:bifunctional non-homologous end joining protein LigD|nr:non-homologous end-joining DNA ligase [Polyangia bacterium]